MSWVEVKKFLNKRLDKSLDEIILDIEERSEGVLQYVRGNIATSGTIIKLTGEGRIYQFDAFVSVKPVEAYDELEILIDGESWYKFKMKSSYYEVYAGVVTTNSSTLVGGNKITISGGLPYESSIWSISANPLGYVGKGEHTFETSQNSLAYAIYVPKYIAFKKSFEIRVTRNNVATQTSSSIASVGYKLL